VLDDTLFRDAAFDDDLPMLMMAKLSYLSACVRSCANTLAILRSFLATYI